METEFRAFFLLVEATIEIRRNSIFKKHSCQKKLIAAKGNGSSGQWKPFFSPFFRDSSKFFSVQQKSFLSEILQSGQWKRTFWLGRTVFFCSKVFLLVETVTETNGNQFLQKDHILTNINDFLASGSHFLSFTQTAASCYLQKQFILQPEYIFQSILHSGQRKRAFCLLEKVLFYSEVCSANGSYY